MMVPVMLLRWTQEQHLYGLDFQAPQAGMCPEKNLAQELELLHAVQKDLEWRFCGRYPSSQMQGKWELGRKSLPSRGRGIPSAWLLQQCP